MGHKRYMFVLVGAWVLFAGLAILHGLRLDDDTYSHFVISVTTIRNADFVAWVTDTWNKPMTTLVYGVIGQLGIIPARLMSVTLVVLSAYWLVDILHVRLGWDKMRATLFVVATYLFQISLLPQIFLTNTEQLAAFLGTLGLWLVLVRKQYFVAGLCMGLVTWARMEAALLVAGVFFGCLADFWRDDSRKAVRDVLVMGVGAAIPALGWWGVTTWGSGDPLWFRTGYVYLREPFWEHLLSVNFLTGLPGSLSSPVLLLVFAGIFLLLRSGSATGGACSLRWMLLLPVLLQGLFFSVMTVYPRDSGYGGWAIASLNARSYNILSPIFCLIAAQGYGYLKGWKRWWGAIGVVLLLLVGHYYFQGAFSLLFGSVLRLGYLLLGAGLLGAFVLLCMLVRRMNDGKRLAMLCGFIVLTAPMMVPFFWYPLRGQDVREETQRAFSAWYLDAYAGQDEAPVVLQSLNGRLDYLGGLPEGSTSWVYSAQLVKAIDQTRDRAVLVVVEELPNGEIAPMCPADLKAILDVRGFKELTRFVPVRGQGAIDRLILRISARNQPVSLVVYGAGKLRD